MVACADNLDSANKNPRTKAPAIQSLINRIVILVVFFVLFLATFNTVAYQFWKEDVEANSWYLDDGSVPGFPIFASYVIMWVYAVSEGLM